MERDRHRGTDRNPAQRHRWTSILELGTAGNLGCGINSPSGEQGPAISKDGRSLFFGSDRPGGFGGNDIWVSQRAWVQDPWGPPVNLGAVVNTAGADNIPTLSRDGHWLFFNSDRPGTSGIGDIWVAYREHIDDDFGWQPPRISASASIPPRRTPEQVISRTKTPALRCSSSGEVSHWPRPTSTSANSSLMVRLARPCAFLS